MIKHGFTNRLKTLPLTFLIALVSLGCTHSQVEVNGKPQAVPKMSAPTEWQFSQLWINDLPLGASIKASGEVLISQPEGFVRILDDHVLPMNQLMIGVHGYASEGYEWVAPVVQLAHNNGLTYFYRWDWTNCPEEAGQRLAHGIEYLYSLYPEVEEIVLFAHSYGGVIATMAAGSIQVPISVVIHTIASPLAGYKRLMDQCDLTYDDAGKLVYPPFADHIYHFQWLTQKDQDGAFRMLATDPQVIDLPKSNVTRLPVSMDGHRLGHNWSVTWVVDTYLGIPHAP